ncbi:hypothetical protein ACFSCW_09240 [Sphingomonas tabacisoli]|uniref:Uncharacterized protein n=1 Tax=Sphingomonas tabacisoli TaxID=2249466 RepID=A0ABW4I232_9SPHN
MKQTLPLTLTAFLAACSATPDTKKQTAAPTATRTPAPSPIQPPAPGTPTGLPDDRTPVSEAPFAKTSAQGAANVVQTYFALIEAAKYAEARALWSDGGKASGMTPEALAASLGRYTEYHAQIGSPGAIKGAAGSLYVDVPAVAYGRLKTGEPFNLKGPITLRRCNDVPGCTAAQREWRIARSELKPVPK